MTLSEAGGAGAGKSVTFDRKGLNHLDHPRGSAAGASFRSVPFARNDKGHRAVALMSSISTITMSQFMRHLKEQRHDQKEDQSQRENHHAEYALGDVAQGRAVVVKTGFHYAYFYTLFAFFA